MKHVGKFVKINVCLIQNCLKQGDTLSPLLLNVAVRYAIRKVHVVLKLTGTHEVVAYAIRKVQETHVVLKLTGTHEVVAYADDVKLPGNYIHTIKKKHRNFN
jgi:hypothetical protein